MFYNHKLSDKIQILCANGCILLALSPHCLNEKIHNTQRNMRGVQTTQDGDFFQAFYTAGGNGAVGGNE